MRVRMGIHCGEAEQTVAGLVGLEVHRAARVAAVGYGGQVLVSKTAAVLVRDWLPTEAALTDLGVHRLKDLGRPERIFELTEAGLQTEFPAVAGQPGASEQPAGPAVKIYRPGPRGGRGPGAGGVLPAGDLDRGPGARARPGSACSFVDERPGIDAASIRIVRAPSAACSPTVGARFRAGPAELAHHAGVAGNCAVYCRQARDGCR